MPLLVLLMTGRLMELRSVISEHIAYFAPPKIYSDREMDMSERRPPPSILRTLLAPIGSAWAAGMNPAMTLDSKNFLQFFLGSPGEPISI